MTQKEFEHNVELAVRPWDPPEEPVRAPRAERPEDHEWELAGTKADHEAPVTYFLWGCGKCKRRLVTECASKDAPFMADQNEPSAEDLRRAGVDGNCLQATVDAVHDL
jgi:hypothetical protein